MEVFLSKKGLARSLGVHTNNLRPPEPDVIIGKWRGWSRERVREDGTVTDTVVHPGGKPLRLMSIKAVASSLNLTTQRIARLRRLRREPSFPEPVACIETGPAERVMPTRGWDGRVYGWSTRAVTAYKNITGRRRGDTQKGTRGRPPGSGNYHDLPRCLHPRTDSVHGDGRPCQAVRRKVKGQWAPACGIHLTDEQRHTLGIASAPPPQPA